MFPDVRTDLRRIAQGIEPRIEKAHPAAAEWGFPVSSLSSRLVWSQLRQTLYQANESAKSPSPSLAGQSVIVNQAGLLAPVHRSFASSRGIPQWLPARAGVRIRSLLQWRDRSGLWDHSLPTGFPM